MDGQPCYRAGFLAPAEADALFQDLRDGVAWRRERLQLFGRPVTVPRLLGWYGDSGVNYRYAAADHLCEGWLPSLAALRARLRRELGLSSNLVLLNRYRHGRDYMGWHRDDETGLQPAIVSLSLGATRRFLLRPPGADRSWGLDLEHGSALTMDGRWRHSLPRTRRPVGERINLTFRLVDRARP
ncbi:MAG: alpha-ketoglutarate-dependent dioxygenase AlkB [Pseudomonadales bacterium]